MEDISDEDFLKQLVSITKQAKFILKNKKGKKEKFDIKNKKVKKIESIELNFNITDDDIIDLK
jgi:hypothetical protein